MTACRRPAARAGAALVAVLLLLVLVLGLTLYYLALVRLEGQTTTILTARRMARHALHSALAEAQTAILRSFQDAGRGPFTQASPSVTSLWHSRGEGGTAAALAGPQTAEHLGWPPPYREEGESALSRLAASAEWVITGDTNAFHSAHAWVAVDLTGLLDPNALHDFDTRFLDFPLAETNRVYLTAREFALVHSNAWPVFMPGAFAMDRGWFDPSSRTWKTNTVISAETLGLDPRTWTRDQAAAALDFLYPGEDLIDAFLDFRDGREVPTNPLGITAVPVPMFNEVWGTLAVTNLGERVAIDISLSLEIWRPYPGNPDTNLYVVPLSPELNFYHPDSSSLGFASRDVRDRWTFPAPSGSENTAFHRLDARLTTDQAVVAPGALIALGFELGGLRLERADNSAVVDELPGELRLRFPEFVLPPSGHVARVEAGLEVTDPRINHVIDEWIPVTSHSLLSINRAAEEVPTPRDGFACWTPAGRAPEWRSAWIGFLPREKPWQSVDLFGNDGRWWLAHTRGDESILNRWRQGLVNPNSHFAEALAAVWVNAPLERWPGDPDARRVTVDQALALAAGLQESHGRDEIHVNRGEWSRAMGALPGGEGGLHVEESLVAHALTRMETSQQLIGILLIAERRAPGGRVLARQRAAVVWWRDPFQPMDGGISVGRILQWTDLPVGRDVP